MDKTYAQKYRENNPNAFKNYYAVNKNCLISKSSDWRKRNRERYNETVRNSKARKRKEVIEKYGSKCVCCGESTYEFLALDHKNNDGANHRKEIRNNRVVSWAIKNDFPDIIQILCHNCNNAKAFYGACPHLGRAKSSLTGY